MLENKTGQEDAVHGDKEDDILSILMTTIYSSPKPEGRVHPTCQKKSSVCAGSRDMSQHCLGQYELIGPKMGQGV